MSALQNLTPPFQLRRYLITVICLVMPLLLITTAPVYAQGGGGGGISLPPNFVPLPGHEGWWVPQTSPALSQPDSTQQQQNQIERSLDRQHSIFNQQGKPFPAFDLDSTTLDPGYFEGVRTFKESPVAFQEENIAAVLQATNFPISDVSSLSGAIRQTLENNQYALLSGIALPLSKNSYIYQKDGRFYLLNEQAYWGLISTGDISGETNKQAIAVAIAEYDQSHSLQLLQRERLPQQVIDQKLSLKRKAEAEGTSGLSPDEIGQLYMRLGRLGLTLQDIPASERAAVARRLSQQPDFAQDTWERLPPSFRDSLKQTAAISREVENGEITAAEGWIHGMAEVGDFFDGMLGTVASKGIEPYANQALELTPDAWEALASEKIGQGKAKLSAFGWVTLSFMLHPEDGLAGVEKTKQDIAEIQQNAAEWKRRHPRTARLLSSSLQIVGTTTAVAGSTKVATVTKKKPAPDQLRKEPRSEIDRVFAQSEITANVAVKLEEKGFPPIAARQTAEIYEESGWLEKYEDIIVDGKIAEKRGHTKRLHVEQTEAQLRARFTDNPDLPGSSSFNSLDDAEKYIQKVIRENENEIREWLTNPDHPDYGSIGVFQMKTANQTPTGRIIRGPKTALENAYGTKVILKRASGRGFIIYTSYPQ